MVFLFSTLFASLLLLLLNPSSIYTCNPHLPICLFLAFCISEFSLGIYFPSMATVRRSPIQMIKLSNCISFQPADIKLNVTAVIDDKLLPIVKQALANCKK